MRTLAVVLAGGTGQRIGSALPKQLIEVGGRPILALAIEAFDRCEAIDEIIVVMAAGHVPAASRIAAPFPKVRAVVEGGASRSESTLAALAALVEEADDARVLLHDAARPFVDQAVIGRCLDALGRYDAVAVGLPASDTIVAVEGDVVTAMPARQSLRRFQTPQGFRLGTVRRAYELALADPAFTATDDCGVVHRYLPDVPIRVVEGSERNLKVTHPLDIALAEHIAKDNADPLPGKEHA
ncbi:2-C-methyl-D-erythritol 4-phosphate cytidylyltransferase [Actinomadura sp. HBU206391]|uniref:2-C-methyl-D-erythritol 4-phosphate cytidylyltransferase n=1 Tax=Actinomadura sp. HBU206391 TaxID=2731692 RepID=UPI0016507E20|nr:2-C-methyl-D-erythritol 4-phosphate cytidylyltransferase [Actinomadura sp. HBU206391]MBC6458143.1 2-C-methyl-D-erythritol 4-phosphate cytidylyltransferase [Actinomadura sp. HBU206391]